MSWRFIPYGEFDGAANMAIDVGLLEKAEQSEPVLRLYGFAPPCLSIGLNQNISAEIIRRVRQRGWHIVRRPSGGRAVLHYRDLTYAFIGAQKGLCEFGILEHSVSAAYKQICAGLQEAFLLLGIDVYLGSSRAAYRHLEDCFLSATNADLVYQGRKIAGSAQLRRRGLVLQHGSIPLDQAQDLVPDLLAAGGSEPALPGADRHANLFEISGHPLDFARLNEIMKSGFEKAFSTCFQESNLTTDELERAFAQKADFSLLPGSPSN